MKRVISLSLLLMLLCGITARAQDFNPTNPPEPGPMTSKLKVLADPAEGGSPSGQGSYVAGTSVSLNAYPKTGFTFVNWTDEGGNVLSTNKSFQYTKQNGTETLIAHYVFNPNNPNEPDKLPSKLTLKAGEGGSVSGGGYYKDGVSVNIHAYPSSHFDFVGWYYDDGTLFSDEAYHNFAMVDHALTLTAKFQFNPDSPAEPDDISTLHRLILKALDGGTVSVGSGKKFIYEGASTTVYAYPNSGYVFDGWYEGEEKVSESTQYTFAMPGEDLTLTAHFLFMPNSPSEPGEIKQRTFTFTLYNVITKPGATAQFPIYLTPRENLTDMTFQLNFSPDLNVDIDNVIIDEAIQGYQIDREYLGLEDGLYGYKYTLTGGTLTGSNTVIPILTFPIVIPENAETAVYHQIKINQISMTNEDGTTQTAGTRNGRVSVYKSGDANGDNDVDIADAVCVVNTIVGKPVPLFLAEVANVDGDNAVDIADAVRIVNFLVGKIGNLARSVQREMNEKEPE